MSDDGQAEKTIEIGEGRSPGVSRRVHDREAAVSTRPLGQPAPRRHLAPEDSDPAFAHKRRRFVDGLERAIAEANCEIIGGTVGALERETFLRLALRVAELRASYIQHGLTVALGRPDRAAIERLAERRVAYEEMRSAFEATQRVVERGYVELAG